MSELNITQLEKYILAEDKTEALKEIPPYTANFYFLEILNEFQRPSKSPEEFDKMLAHFVDNGHAPHDKVQLVKLMSNLQQISSTRDNPELLKKSLAEFNKNFLQIPFEYASKNRGQLASGIEAQERPDVKSRLSTEEQSDISLSNLLNRLYALKTQNVLNELSGNFYDKIDLSRFDMKEDSKLIETILRNIPRVYEVPNIVELINLHRSLHPAKNFIADEIWFKLDMDTKARLLESEGLKLNQNLLIPFIMEKFEVSKLEDQNNSLDARIKGWESLLTHFESLPDKYTNYRSLLLLKILELKSKKDEFDEELFFRYLKLPLWKEVPCLKKEFREVQKKKQPPLSFSIIGFTQNIDPSKIIEDYLNNLLLGTKQLKSYLEIFEENKIHRTLCLLKLENGEVVDNANDFFNPSELQDMHNKKTLDLICNAGKFDDGEKVTFKLALKNISYLTIRVFEVNTVNFVNEKKNCSFETIDVTGILPVEEYNHVYKQSPMISHIEEYAFESISKRNLGVFIVDFTGSDLNSRAIVQKGSLTIVNDGQTGRNCVIIDKNGKICTGSDTGIYIGNTFIQADAVSGLISVPLNIGGFSCSVVTVHDGFATMCNLSVTDPQPSLSINVVYNAESFVTGNQAEFVIQAKLMMNSQVLSPTRLTNVSAIATITNTEGVQMQNNFKDLKLKDSEDLIISFIFPKKAKSILIELTGEIKIGTETKSLLASQSLTLEDTNDSNIERYFFKKNEDNEIFVEVLGRNGEPIANVGLSLEIGLKFLNTTKNFQLTSDSKGQIYIGRIENLNYLVITGQSGMIRYSDSSPRCSFYSPFISSIEDEPIALTLSSDKEKVSLVELSSNGSVKYDLTNTHTMINGQTLSITGMKAGNFLLTIGEQNISVRVFKGEYFNLNGQNIRTKSSIVPFAKNSKDLIARIKKDEHNNIAIEVDGDSEKIRAHLLVYNYLPQEKQLIESEVSAFSKKGSPQSRNSFDIGQNSNIYQSGKRVNSEVIYVNDRKTKSSFMGNTLEKPGMIIKRNKLGQTSETIPVMPPGTNYQTQQSFGQQQKSAMLRCGAPLMKCSPMMRPCNQAIKTLGFLSHPGKIFTNVKIENGEISLPEEAKSQFSYSIIVLSDGSSTSLFEVNSLLGETTKSDCRLPSSKQAGYIIQHERKLAGVLGGSSMIVKNIKNTEICVIDDMRMLFETLQQLQQESEEAFKEFSFLKNWINLDPMDKLRKYDKYASHELNIFLFNKDREFFDSVVEALLRNKREKQFVDFYLLDDQKGIDEFCNFTSFMSLNKLELALLAQACSKSRPEFSSAILKYFKDSSVLKKVPELKMASIFDTLLSSRGEKVNYAELETQVYAGNDDYTTNEMFGYAQPGGHQNAYSYAQPQMEMKSSRGLPRSNRGRKESLDGRYYDTREEECNVNFCDQEFTQNKDIFTPSQGTIEYNERQWWKMELDKDIQPFWSELADFLVSNGSSKNFLPEFFVYAISNFSDCMTMLSFIDLSFDKVKFDSLVKGSDLIIGAHNHILLLSKEIMEKEGEQLDINVLCAQRFFDPDDRFVYDDQDPTMRVDKKVDEFIVNKVYGSRVVVTNCTSSDLSLVITYEVPQGAIVIGSSDFLKVVSHVLGSLQSQVFEFSFYFPSVGSFSIYPATVSKGSRILAIAQGNQSMVVRTEKSIRNLETINDILAVGSKTDIIEFIKTKNVLNDKIFKFDSIYYLLKDVSFYRDLIKVLRSRGILEPVVWSFSIYHSDLETFRELLSISQKAQVFSFAKYLKVDQLIILDQFETREYFPLINKRAHSIGTERINIFNDSFKNTYTQFLHYLLEKGTPSTEDYLLFANYLIVQDRFDEAAAIVKKANQGGEAQTQIQRDYLLAYMDFVRGYPDFTQAKAICAEYLAHPLLSWRNLFIEMANQLAEFEESALLSTADEVQAEKKTNTDKAQKAPVFSSELEGAKIKIISQNVQSVKIDYFKIDIEVLYSLTPFELQNNKSPSYVKPYFNELVSVGSGADHLVSLHSIPANVCKDNLFIQISVNEKGSRQSHFLSFMPFALHHHVNTEFGILKLVDPHSKKPVPKIYVKCFVKYKTGTISFYKDGYTDLRGSFDYVSLNKDEVNDVQLFGVVVVDSQYGYKILEVAPPIKIGRVEGEAKQLVSKNWSNLQKTKAARPELSKYARQI
jgi:hypothetical protein